MKTKEDRMDEAWEVYQARVKANQTWVKAYQAKTKAYLAWEAFLAKLIEIDKLKIK